MSFSEFVIGGIGVPRVLLVDSNLCDIPRFSGGLTTGWAPSYAVNGNTFGSSNSYIEAYKEYVCRMTWGGIHDSYYGQYSKSIVGTDIAYLAGKKVLVAFRIKSNIAEDYKIKVTLEDTNASAITKEFYINSRMKRFATVFDYSAVVIPAPVPNPNVLRLKIYGSDDNEDGVDVIFDDIYICEVKEDFLFECASESYLNFEEDLMGSNKLMDGKTQKFNRRWRPNYIGGWQWTDKEYEAYRQKIVEELEYNAFCFPHTDFDWGFFVTHDGEYERRYPFNRFLGHEFVMHLSGNEFLKDTIHPITIDE